MQVRNIESYFNAMILKVVIYKKLLKYQTQSSVLKLNNTVKMIHIKNILDYVQISCYPNTGSPCCDLFI